MGTTDTKATIQEEAVTEAMAEPSQPPPRDTEKQATAQASIACGDVLPSDVERQAVSSNAEPGSDHGAAPVDAGEEAGSATTVVQRWCRPRGNVLRLAFAFLSFFIAGMNDAAVGALLPYLEEYYDLNYTTVSLIFLTPFAGYSVAAFTNARIHLRFGQRGVAVMAPLCHIVAFIIVCVHPPFPVLVVIYGLSGFGNGLTDAAYCAWVGVMEKSNQIQGFMHSSYSVGALCAPLISTSMVVHSELAWYNYFYIMVALSVLEWVGLVATFWKKTGAVYRAEHPRDEGSKGAGTKEALKSKVTWLGAVYFFTYMGVEVGLGGWVVTFMLRVRHAGEFAAGATGSGFWAGQAAGRMALGFVTERFGERISIVVYLVASIALQLIFWLVPNLVVSAVAASLVGFFIGPMFPGAINLTAKLLPKHIHVSAMGFAMALGGTGGTIFPFIIGAIAQAKGVWVLQPFVLGLFVALAVTWFLYPRAPGQ